MPESRTARRTPQARDAISSECVSPSDGVHYVNIGELPPALSRCVTAPLIESSSGSGLDGFPDDAGSSSADARLREADRQLAHSRAQQRRAERHAAEAAHARIFGGARCCRLYSLDSKPWAGNAILGAARAPRGEPEGRVDGAADGVADGGFFEPAALLESADAARRRLNVAFDLVARCRARELSAATPP